jgi:hypothetical protein
MGEKPEVLHPIRTAVRLESDGIESPRVAIHHVSSKKFWAITSNAGLWKSAASAAGIGSNARR